MSKVKLYNKGKREWNICGQQLNPGKSIEVDEKVAEKFAANYHTDFVVGGEAPQKVNVRALNAKIKKLEEENAELKSKLAKKTTSKKSEEKAE
jgi:uncharacterized small protein (DUF1192 family)